MRFTLRRLAALASLAVATSLAPPLHAQSDADRATARSLGQEGEAALDASDFKTAADRFRRADRLVHAPTLMLGLARSLNGLHKFVEAQETYNRIIREGVTPGASQVFKDAVDQAKREVDSVAPHIGGVTIVVQAAGGGDVPNVKVVLDGAPMNNASLGVRRAIDPGPHVLQVSADGFKPAELHFDITEGGAIDAPVSLEKDPNAVVAPVPTPVPPPTPGVDQRVMPPNPGPEQPVTASSSLPPVLPWATLGVGAAGLVFGGITGVVAMGKHSDLVKVCPGGNCNSDQQSAVDSYHSMATLSTVGFIVGGIGVAGGVVMLLLKPSSSQTPPAAAASSLRVTPVVGLGSVGAVGTF